jgi:hypothetical protein
MFEFRLDASLIACTCAAIRVSFAPVHFPSWAMNTAGRTPAPTLMILEGGKVVLQLVGASGIGWLGVRWALRRYKSEKDMGKRFAAYADGWLYRGATRPRGGAKCGRGKEGTQCNRDALREQMALVWKASPIGRAGFSFQIR